jgi:hypothetical protein
MPGIRYLLPACLFSAMLVLAPSACTNQRDPSAPAAQHTNMELRFVTLAGAPVVGAKVSFALRGRTVPSFLLDSLEGLTTAAGTFNYHTSHVAGGGWCDLAVTIAPPANSALRPTAIVDSLEWVVSPAPLRVINVVLQPR